MSQLLISKIKICLFSYIKFSILFRELKDLTCRVANALKTQGIKRGDRVAIYMPVSLMAAATMLACTRIGAVHRWVCNI